MIKGRYMRTIHSTEGDFMKDHQSQTRQLLTEIYKGADMGEKAAQLISGKSKSGDFVQVVSGEGAQFAQIFARAGQELEAFGGAPTLPAVTKLPLTAGIGMQTLADKSESRLARILIDGSTMGITQVHDAIAKNPSADPAAIDLANQLAGVSSAIIEDMKRFL